MRMKWNEKAKKNTNRMTFQHFNNSFPHINIWQKPIFSCQVISCHNTWLIVGVGADTRVRRPAAGRWLIKSVGWGDVRFVGYGACRRTAWQDRLYPIRRFRSMKHPSFSDDQWSSLRKQAFAPRFGVIDRKGFGTSQAPYPTERLMCFAW